jgi:hypothetical protein
MGLSSQTIDVDHIARNVGNERMKRFVSALTLVGMFALLLACGGSVAATAIPEQSCLGLSSDVCGRLPYCTLMTDYQDGQNHYRDGCFRKCELTVLRLQFVAHLNNAQFFVGFLVRESRLTSSLRSLCALPNHDHSQQVVPSLEAILESVGYPLQAQGSGKFLQ